MCGRYAIECEEENVVIKEILQEINRRYAGSTVLSQMKTGEIFPTDTVPILAREKGSPTPVLMNWGFPRSSSGGMIDGIPKKPKTFGGVIINARAETAQEKNMFRASMLSRRCVVPSTGFWEWRQDPNKKKKDKYLLRPPEGPMMYMAGLYNLFVNSEGSQMPGFVIVTTAANQWVSLIHNRMPLILSEDESNAWLQDTAFASELLSRPCQSKLLVSLQPV